MRVKSRSKQFLKVLTNVDKYSQKGYEDIAKEL